MTHEQIIKLAREAAKGSHRMELVSCFGLQGMDELERFALLCRAELTAQVEAKEEEAHQLSERIIKLTKERDALATAAKLAMDALSASYPTVRSRLRAHNKAIEELRQVGVQ